MNYELKRWLIGWHWRVGTYGSGFAFTKKAAKRAAVDFIGKLSTRL
jgi:hypothetical protein